MSSDERIQRDVYHHDLSVSSDGSRRFWRSLDELHQTPEFIERLHAEFPLAAAEWDELDESNSPDGGMSRRNFLALMGASIALAGLNTGCETRPPDEKIVPYVVQPEHIVPGVPLTFATSVIHDGHALGALATSYEGRPVKIEGNPQHPANAGGTNVWMQASILSLYDPNRSRVVVHLENVSTWADFARTIDAILLQKLAAGGRGLRFLAEPTTSPTLIAQINSLRERYPQIQWHTWSPTDRAAARAGAQMFFGRPVNTIYQLDRAGTILSLDNDFLLTDEPGHLRYAKQFIDARRVRAERHQMNRLYMFESTRSITGAMADHRYPLAPDQVAYVAASIARLLGAQQFVPSGEAGPIPVKLEPIVEELRAAGKNAVVIPGPGQPPVVHAACHAINAILGSAGNTVVYTDVVEHEPSLNATESIAQLVADINAGQVDCLFILGGNPVYDAPADLDFAAALDKVRLRVRLGLHEDETSTLCHWHLPMAHEFEAWGDARSFDGTASIVQPLIAPLYEGRSVIEVLSMLLGDVGRPAYEIVRNAWRQQFPGSNFDEFWDNSLRDGFIAGTTLQPIQPRMARQNAPAPEPSTQPSAARAGGIRVIFKPDPTIWDGRWAPNAWLQETPKPITRLMWDNAALISPKTATDFSLKNESLIEIRYRDRSVRAPVWIVPGLPDNCITLHLGYGRERAGKVGTGHGFNAYSIRTSDSLGFGFGAQIVRLNVRQPLVSAQQTQLMHGRDLVRVHDIAKWRSRDEQEHNGGAGHHKVSLMLFDLPDAMKNLEGNAWGMSIDLNACIGCNACIVACQSENNIPVVGKEQAGKGRYMHWLRIDTYFASATGGHDEDRSHHFKYHDHVAPNPEVYFQPIACMHCETAPCELVCPVGATVHDTEGTNNMVYNRCIGTRYCSNNCPYKVRRFNWFEFNGPNVSASEALMKNPQVTIRSRGVMEKCTYCIQRINKARISAKKAGRPFGWVEDGEVNTACAQACPTTAIVFGNINDKTAHVTRLKHEPHDYGLLVELNTKPRTTYLSRFKNANDAVKA